MTKVEKNRYGWEAPVFTGWEEIGNQHYGLSADCFSCDLYFHQGTWWCEVSGLGWAKEKLVGKRKTLQAGKKLCEEQIARRLALFCKERVGLIKDLGYVLGPNFGVK